MEKGLILSVEQIYRYINSLKTVGGGYLTNIFNFEELKNSIKHKRISFEYEAEGYLNLLCEESAFYRLYFFVAAGDRYHFEPIGKTVVCDVFIIQKNVLFEKIVNQLYSSAFVQHACIGKWLLNSFDRFPVSSMEGYTFGYEKTIEIMDKVISIFDRYTDYLPDKKEYDLFFKDKKFINLYKTAGHKYIGSLIYTEKKRMATLEFYFIVEEERGQGLSRLLHEHLYQLVKKKEYKIVSYIHENNLASIAVHQKYGYQKDQLERYVFLNRG